RYIQEKTKKRRPMVEPSLNTHRSSRSFSNHEESAPSSTRQDSDPLSRENPEDLESEDDNAAAVMELEVASGSHSDVSSTARAVLRKPLYFKPKAEENSSMSNTENDYATLNAGDIGDIQRVGNCYECTEIEQDPIDMSSSNRSTSISLDQWQFDMSVQEVGEYNIILGVSVEGSYLDSVESIKFCIGLHPKHPEATEVDCALLEQMYSDPETTLSES
ncbi:hypothetical protein BGX26_011318, partial [Mortierella sp. AD094]